jgi:hypothetical protein
MRCHSINYFWLRIVVKRARRTSRRQYAHQLRETSAQPIQGCQAIRIECLHIPVEHSNEVGSPGEIPDYD